jgi:hypothetical protein
MTEHVVEVFPALLVAAFENAFFDPRKVPKNHDGRPFFVTIASRSVVCSGGTRIFRPRAERSRRSAPHPTWNSNVHLVGPFVGKASAFGLRRRLKVGSWHIADVTRLVANVGF